MNHMHSDWLQWIAIVLVIVGALLTGLNVYPLNVFFQAYGSLMWAFIAAEMNNMPLLALNLACMGVLIAGMVYNVSV